MCLIHLYIPPLLYFSLLSSRLSQVVRRHYVSFQQDQHHQKIPKKCGNLPLFFEILNFLKFWYSLSLSNLSWRFVYDEECRSQGEVSPFIHMDLSRRTAEEILDKFKDGTYLGKW